MAGTPDPYAAFRLNLEQQRKRAKDLLRAVRADDPPARARVASVMASHTPAPAAFKLADAQFVIARELRFATWRELRAHIAAQTAARIELTAPATAPDHGLRTLHVRCGSDIEQELARAGFTGDFLSLWDPFPVGPVTSGPDWIERRARFHAAEQPEADQEFDAFYRELTEADERLTRSTDDYERVVIWMEHDSHDQLSTVRCLAHYARTRPPRVLELISVDYFPGSDRFIGLGQLPPEAMRLLWRRRFAAEAPQLQIAAAVWAALTADDPRPLAALVRSMPASLPHLGPALQRHLRELPSRRTGLSLTQTLMLQAIADGATTISDVWRQYVQAEPLPFLGDTEFLRILADMGRASAPLFERTPVDASRPFRDRVAITSLGRSVLRGETDWLSLSPPPRWVGGVCIRAAGPVWRWDEERSEVC